MNLQQLNLEYDKLQKKYGAKDLDAIYYGGCQEHPDICFVFMNPTGRNIASSKEWAGLKSPWIGTKNVWTIFNDLGLLDNDIYMKIRTIKGKDWTKEFAEEVYKSVSDKKYFITNLGKCTQLDARELKDDVFLKYLKLFKKEIGIVKPKVIILFGNQVSSIVLGEKISVSRCRRQVFRKKIHNEIYKFYPVYYPVGNGRFNMDKAIEDIKWIINKEVYGEE